jgi:hypothetical protein
LVIYRIEWVFLLTEHSVDASSPQKKQITELKEPVWQQATKKRRQAR